MSPSPVVPPSGGLGVLHVSVTLLVPHLFPFSEPTILIVSESWSQCSSVISRPSPLDPSSSGHRCVVVSQILLGAGSWTGGSMVAFAFRSFNHRQ